MLYRTSDFCRVKAVEYVRPCPTASENYVILQAFYDA
jgi:hypothetical protein